MKVNFGGFFGKNFLEFRDTMIRVLKIKDMLSLLLYLIFLYLELELTLFVS